MRRGESEITKREDHLPASRVFDVEKFFSRDKRGGEVKRGGTAENIGTADHGGKLQSEPHS